MLNMVSLISCIHLWWGISLIIGIELPRPFGALEPFYKLPFANDLLVGISLTVSGLLPLTSSYWPKSWWCISCLMVPQQAILTWGFVLGVVDVVISHDGRSWYALGYTGTLFIFHLVSLRDEFVVEMIRKRS